MYSLFTYFSRITVEEFLNLKLRQEIIEIFPKEDAEIFYEPPRQTKHNETICARGCLYNTYKFIRKQLRESGILLTKGDNSEAESAQNIVEGYNNL